ncbi:MAG: iron ABC transporter permease [Eggerthellaceae bacterium]|nr:iron ABC transporter permease [Eggerthellaceae bacterium]
MSEAFEEAAVAAFSDEAEKTYDERLPLWVKIVLPAGLIAIVLVSFALGKFAVTPPELVEGIVRHFKDEITTQAELSLDKIIFNIRIPRILLVVMVGAALASAGATFQGMFRNPLVSPDLLGASAGASLGACIGILLGWGVLATQLFSFATGLLAVSIAVFLNRMVKYDKLLGLVLGGILVSTLFQAGTSIVKLCADANDKLPSITYWLMGSFSGANQRDLAIAVIPMLLGFIILMSQRWRLNVLSLGEDEARSLGVNTRRTRVIVIVAATLLTSVSVSVSGVIGWIGLIIPHLARAVVGPDHRKLLPAAMILGASYLLIVDDIARCLLSMEIPIGILTALLGVPVFAVIFHYNSKGWN